MGGFLVDYGAFLLKLVTFVVLVGGAVLVVVAASRKSSSSEGIHVRHLNDEIDQRNDIVQKSLLDGNALRKFRKARDRARKHARSGEAAKRRRIFVLEFKGDIRASATASLREEITAIIGVASENDEVILKLENAGGAVHEHGLAASQLLRLKRAGLRLTIAVDKIAASGGYLMACVADRVVAAPFAVIGSIGVVAQLPNFHRFLDARGVDFEQITAGRFKRTLTVFGQNTDEGREKLKEELEEVHDLFKQQIAEQRPAVDIDAVATGEHWYGSRALELKLIDAIGTSDDMLREAAAEADLYSVRYKRRQKLPDKLLGAAETLLSR